MVATKSQNTCKWYHFFFAQTYGSWMMANDKTANVFGVVCHINFKSIWENMLLRLTQPNGVIYRFWFEIALGALFAIQSYFHRKRLHAMSVERYCDFFNYKPLWYEFGYIDTKSRHFQISCPRFRPKKYI
jgi:hypothetical protein